MPTAPFTPSIDARIADALTVLANLFRERDEQGSPEGDHVLSLVEDSDEIVKRLRCSRAWLERRENWRKVGGYKDRDGHIKFTVAGLAAHVRRAAK